MKHAFIAFASLLAASSFAFPTPFTGNDYSGVYDCNGVDDHEGKYTGVVTLALVKSQSTGDYGAYRFTLEASGYGSYPGHAAANGNSMGIYFALTDPQPKDFGTGIATFTKTPQGKWSFKKYYYEPEFKGGNFGIETCVMR
jgi:hypothetical protein